MPNKVKNAFFPQKCSFLAHFLPYFEKNIKFKKLKYAPHEAMS